MYRTKYGQNRLVSLDNLKAASDDLKGSSGSHFMDYDANAKSIALGCMNDVGGTNLDAMAVLLDLPNGRNDT